MLTNSCSRDAPYPNRAARFRYALLAGTIAIALNMAALAFADIVPVATAHGGLLRLIKSVTAGIVTLPTGTAFQMSFHVVVGLAMAEVYAFALEPWLPGPSWVRGLLYALALWLANAFIILPATGEGLAGSRHLSLAGIVWFAAAHTLFFLVMAQLYARLRHKHRWNTLDARNGPLRTG